MAVFVLGLVLVVVALLVVVAASIYSSRHPDALEELGVKATYSRGSLPADKIEAYGELKEKLRQQYGKSSGDNDIWMSALPLEAKDMLKYRLMQRAIGDMAALQKIDGDARGYWRLFSKGVITRKFWNSVVEAERELSLELEAVKGEAAHVEPTQDPQGIISEAMQYVVRFGDKMPAANEIPGKADAIGDLMKQLPHPGMPHPGMPHPGAPHPGMPHPGHPGMGQPPPMPPGVQAEVQGSGYNWRQDADEVEVSASLPNNATKAEVKVRFQSRSLRIEHAGNVVVEGQLAAVCRPEGSTWTLSKGKVVVSLEKADSRPWPDLFAPSKA
mmetsp:Transcript_29786/g.67475  ORF Transcript_29786/g.67475 Transcript_29786/m.67475 type:complete len:328 (+) Transcript_29786:70-1053(+)|eukprot:CAMPEP_0197937548 /NCGR_PEP_ID=MMETSP1439-20131203/116658_1 /TAXON_ID=66791 /ORGANISM="Gonyaulax spinifera, Strain CCMP409" /LENGTH=327 /DNA_ID=CAMNT_0043560579 /DNA_START=64 /DNA_END=1047 /DNA_ORIENTATION=+